MPQAEHTAKLGKVRSLPTYKSLPAETSFKDEGRKSIQTNKPKTLGIFSSRPTLKEKKNEREIFRQKEMVTHG